MQNDAWMTKIISKILGVKRVSKSEGRDSLEYVALTRKGLNKKNLVSLANTMNLSLKEISEILPVSERTLQRYKPGQQLDKKTSEQILEIARLYSEGFKVFNNHDLFKQWMEYANSALGNVKPIDLLDTSFGIELLIDELGKIQYGIFA